MNLSIDECKVLWVVGAAERLATMGLLSPNIPMNLTSDAVEDFIEIGKLMDYKPGWAHIAWKERKARISQAEWKPPSKPIKYRKFNMSEIMKQAGIPEPPWGK